MRRERKHVLRKTLRVLVNPLRWGVVFRRIAWLVETNATLLGDIIRRRAFTSNPNSRTYWNRKLSGRDFWRDDHYRLILDLLPASKEFSLLDIGCALGDGCRLIKKTFPTARIAGADISEVGIEKASKKANDIQNMVLDILSDPIPGQYGYVALIETMEHFDDPFTVLDKCLRAVRESVIICVPFRQDFAWSVRWGKKHRHSFDENTFARYKCRTVRATDYLPSTGTRYIIYEIEP